MKSVHCGIYGQHGGCCQGDCSCSCHDNDREEHEERSRQVNRACLLMFVMLMGIAVIFAINTYHVWIH